MTFYDLETMILKGTDFQHLQQQLKEKHKDTKMIPEILCVTFGFVSQAHLGWQEVAVLCVWVHVHPMSFASCQHLAFASTRLHLLHFLIPFCGKLDFHSATEIFAGSSSLVAWCLGTDTVLNALALDARTFLVPFLLLRASELSRMGLSWVHVSTCP